MNALILVDIQNDFMPWGALPVRDGDRVIQVANRLMESGKYDFVVATQDFHPAGHGSFASQYPGKNPGDCVELGGVPQVLWPDHCVQWTGGSLFAPGLNTRLIQGVVAKGTDGRIDSYSGFFDNARKKETGLRRVLEALGVDEVTIVGLATDYCVKFTALDARELGLKVTVCLEGCRGVELRAGDVERAVAQMRAKGASVEEHSGK
jgi:nicotinamidase/pyrazinamidase